MIDDHKGGIIGIMPNAYYLAKKKNPLNHISDLCGLSELQGVVPGKTYDIMIEIFYVCEKDRMAGQCSLYCGGLRRRN